MGHMEHDMLALRKIKKECEDVIGESIDILYWHTKDNMIMEWKYYKWNSGYENGILQL